MVQAIAANAYLLEHTTHDTTKASEYGDVRYVFPADYSRPSIWNSAAFGTTLVRRLERLDYRPDRDYLVLSGSTLTLNVAIAAISQHWGPFNALAFNSRTARYEPIRLGELDATEEHRPLRESR